MCSSFTIRVDLDDLGAKMRVRVCPRMSAKVRVCPRKSANVRLRTVRLRTDADYRGLRVSAKVRESPLMSLGLVWTFDSPQQSAKVREKIEKVSGRLSRTFADVFQLDGKHNIVSPPNSAGVRVCPRTNVSQADISELSLIFVDSIREYPRRTVRSGGSRTFADYLLRTFVDCHHGLFTRTFSDYSPRTIADCLHGQLRTIVRGLSQIFPWTFVDYSPRTFADLFPRTFTDFPRGHLQTFSDYCCGRSRTFSNYSLQTFEDITQWTF